MNSTILQIPSPVASSPSERTAPRPQEGKSSTAGGTKKSFASVLRTAQQLEDKGRAQQPEKIDSGRAARTETEPNQGKDTGDEAPRSGESNGRSVGVEGERSSQNHAADSGDREGRDGTAAQVAAPAATVEGLGPLSPMVPVQSSQEQSTDSLQSMIEDEPLVSSKENEVTEATAMPVMLSSMLEEPVTAPAMMDQAAALPQELTVPVVQQEQIASATQPTVEAPDASAAQSLDPTSGLVVKAVEQQAVDQEAGEQKGTSAQGSQNEKLAAGVQPSTEAGKQGMSVSQELSRLDAGGPQPTQLVEQSVQQKQAEPAVHPHQDSHVQPLPPDAGGEKRDGKLTADVSHGLQAGAESGKPSDLSWSHQDERQPGSHETPWQPPALHVPSQSDSSSDHSTQAITAGNAASLLPRSIDSRPAMPAGPVSSLSPALDIEPFVPSISRSVVFEIAEPDLGRIHVRVAMTNELVHAHLSSDRSEIGQFLINGQDRLQSALQSNGLEMGQFRVDIDRQSAGRSFQQGPSQDQSRMWQETSNGASREAGFVERQYETNLSYAGRLNLVA